MTIEQRAKPEAALPPVEPVSLLLVDDRPENLVALEAVLEGPEYRLFRATSGEEALNLALRESFAVILLDVMMPGMDGFEVAAHLKKIERTREVPIMFLTALASDIQHIYRAYDVGALDYLIKPLDPDIVRKKVAVLADLTRQRREIRRQAELLRAAERLEFEVRLAELRVATDQRYRKLFDGINHAIAWTMDEEMLLTFVSGQAPGILGYPMAEIIQPSFWKKRLFPEDREAFLGLFRRGVRGESDEPLRLNHRMVTSDGRVVWFHTAVSAEGGGTGVLHGVSVDVSDIKDAEETQTLLADVAGVLSESLDYRVSLPRVAAAVVASIGDWCLIDELVEGTWVQLAAAHADPSKRSALDALSRSRAMTGITRLGPSQPAALQTSVIHRDVPGTSWLASAIGAADEAAVAALGAASCMFVPLRTRHSTLGLMTIVSSGLRRFTEADRRVVDELGRRVALAIDNALLYEGAQRAMRAREQVLAIVSHDLRSPLQSIVLQATNLDLDDLDEAARARLEKQAATILRAARRMDRLIADLLDFSQLDAGRLKVRREPVSVSDLLGEMVESAEPLAKAKGLAFEVRAVDGLVACADRERVLQVLANLVQNAIKFTPRGGVVTLGVARDENCARFCIADTGPGIAREEQAHVWNRFWRSHRAVAEGVGLGLSIAKGLVEAQRGRMWLDSEPGTGSKFFFTLPLVEEASKLDSEPACA